MSSYRLELMQYLFQENVLVIDKNAHKKEILMLTCVFRKLNGCSLY